MTHVKLIMQILLTQQQAEERFASVEAPIKYETFFHLQKGKEYSGLVQATFTLKQLNNVFFDFSGTKIVSVKVNETSYTQEQIVSQWKSAHLNLLEEHLKVGQNQVTIHFENQYNNDGNGLHSSLDSKGGQFMYIQSEPYWINRVFPCFDQPDLKGNQKFHFLTPNEWSVISNTSVDKKLKAEENDDQQSDFEKQVRELYKDQWNGEQDYWTFKETLRMSPYSFVQYDGIDGEAPCRLRIYYNQDLEVYIQVQKRYIFAYYIEAIKFYEEFFQTKSPWEKYDTIICQEYTVGAMEFPGCITYTDRLIFRCKQPTPNQVSLMGHVIVHELAHMWFGDLVTMKWWNDLWLNESFADFMCYLCQSFIDKKIPVETTDAWTNMLKRKAWGYHEDQQQTTHPIACVVENTSKADSIFDGITYSKGAAVLKQLYYLIGHERFSNNLKTYFEKYSFNNATLAQFLAEIEKGEQTENHPAYDLKLFNQEWIEKAGVNEVIVQWDQSKQGKQTLTLKQTSFLQEHPTLRYHKMKLGFFDKDANVVMTKDVILENKEQTQIEIENNNFVAVLPNYEDWCFIKIQFDNSSLEFFQNNFSRIENPLSKLLILRAFYDMVKDARSKGTDFIDSLLNNNAVENSLGNPIMIQAVIDYLQGSLSFIPQKFVSEYKSKIFNEILRCLQLTKDINDINIMKPKLISTGSSVANIEKLKQMFDCCYNNLTLDFTNEEKWRIVFKIHTSEMYSDQQKNMYLTFLQQQDTTDVGKDWTLAINGLTQCDSKLEEYFKEITSKDRTLSYHKVEYLLVGFNSKCSRTFKKNKYALQFFELLPEILNQDTKEIGKTLVNSGIPGGFSNQFIIKKLQEVISKVRPDLEFHVRKLQKEISNYETIQKAYDLYECQ